MKDNSCGTEDEPLFDFFAVAVFTEVERRIKAQAGFPEQGMLGLPFRVFDTKPRFHQDSKPHFQRLHTLKTIYHAQCNLKLVAYFEQNLHLPLCSFQ